MVTFSTQMMIFIILLFNFIIAQLFTQMNLTGVLSVLTVTWVPSIIELISITFSIINNLNSNSTI